MPTRCKPIAAAAFLAALTVLSPRGASATSIPEFDRKTPEEKSAIIFQFLERVINALSEKDPVFASEILKYFESGKGIEDLFKELSRVDLLAREGKLDRSKIQVENVIRLVLTRKFPPPAGANTKPPQK